jgi:hypothetical protein
MTRVLYNTITLENHATHLGGQPNVLPVYPNIYNSLTNLFFVAISPSTIYVTIALYNCHKNTIHILEVDTHAFECNLVSEYEKGAGVNFRKVVGH